MDANELLMGGGTTSAKFKTIGTIVKGFIIAEPKSQQQRDLDTGEVRTFSNGDPMWQIVVTLATEERDPSNPEDDGVRSLYVKGQMFNAVRDAVRASGAKGLAVDGFLAVQFASEGEPKKKGFNPPKLFRAAYTPPAPKNNANDLLMGPPSTPPSAPYSTPHVATPPTSHVASVLTEPPVSLPPLPPAPSEEQRLSTLDRLRRAGGIEDFQGTGLSAEEIPF